MVFLWVAKHCHGLPDCSRWNDCAPGEGKFLQVGLVLSGFGLEGELAGASMTASDDEKEMGFRAGPTGRPFMGGS